MLFIWIVKKKRLIKWEEAPRETRGKIKRNEKKINSMLYLISGALFLFCFIVFILPAFFDIPNVLNENYLEVSGVVESWNYSNEDKMKERAIGIIDKKTQERISVTVYSKGLHKGDYVRVCYLPCSKYGSIIK